VFWKNIDPLDDGGQFCDRGYQYTTAIFVNSEEQRQAAEASKRELKGRFDQAIVTPIRDAKPFTRRKNTTRTIMKSARSVTGSIAPPAAVMGASMKSGAAIASVGGCS